MFAQNVCSLCALEDWSVINLWKVNESIYACRIYVEFDWKWRDQLAPIKDMLRSLINYAIISPTAGDFCRFRLSGELRPTSMDWLLDVLVATSNEYNSTQTVDSLSSYIVMLLESVYSPMYVQRFNISPVMMGSVPKTHGSWARIIPMSNIIGSVD